MLELTDAQVERLLRKNGYFPWGHDSWIHESDEGFVMSAAAAIVELLGDPEAVDEDGEDA